MKPYEYDSWMNDQVEPLAIQTYIKLARANPQAISFSAGLPDLSLLPIDALKSVAMRLQSEPNSVFQYGAAHQLLKQQIVDIMQRKSLLCSTDNVLLVSGAQQGIYLSAQLFLREKSPLLIEEFVYPGFLQVAKLFRPQYQVIPVSVKHGLDLDCLESALKQGMVLPYFYTVTNGHNPLGLTMTLEQRKTLVSLSEQYGFIIVEDDPYGQLNLTGETFKPLCAYTDNAIYIGSFSKVVSPALRIGWMVGNVKIIQKLEQLKDTIDLSLLNPNQLLLSHFLAEHNLPDMVAPQCAMYLRKRDCMVAALNQHMTVPFSYTLPQHGMFLWLEIDGVDLEAHKDFIFKDANVLYIPGSAFSALETRRSAIRLNYSYPSFEDVEQGVKSLSQSITKLAVVTNNACVS